MNGCCYGRKSELPWAITYPFGHDTFPDGAERAVPVHPTQIYDALLGLALYTFLAWLYRRKKFDGQIFAAYLICYAFARSLVEYFRGDYTPGHIYGNFFTPGQLVSVGIFAAGVALAIMLRRQKTKSQILNPK
jgi:phosphatidylglycerol:prolipoprotein diacylglycerol transferase